MSPAITTLIIILFTMIFFIFEILPLAVTAMLVILSLIGTGILPVSSAFQGFSNDITLLIVFMSAVGEALFKTGVGQRVANQILKFAGRSEVLLVLAVTLLGTILSSVSSNTGATLVLLPLVLSTARIYGKSPSHLLIPLSFGTAFGGILTLVGRAPNMVVSGYARQMGLAAFGFFEFAALGLPIALVGIVYMVFIGRKLLKDRADCRVLETGQEAAAAREDKQWTAVFILAGVIVSMVAIRPIQEMLGFNLTTIAMIGAILTVATGCISIDEFFHSVNWTAIFLFAGLMPLGQAMQETGAARMIADMIIDIAPEGNDFILLAILFLVGGILAQFMSHTAATTILAPVFYTVGMLLGLNPRTLLMLLAISTGLAVATPIGTPPNIIVYGAGNYNFMDFVKAGLPVLFIGLVMTLILLPLFFSLN